MQDLNSPRLSSHRRHGRGSCSWNGISIYDERSEAIVLESRNQHEPEVPQTLQVPVNLSMRTGEVLTLNLYLTHHCKGTQAIMLWGGEGNSGRDSISRAP